MLSVSLGAWGQKFLTVAAAWRRAWERMIPFFAFPPAIRKVIYTTNAIESINAQLRKIIKTRGHFPTDQAALKCLYLVARSLDPTGTAKKRWMNRWKPALNAFAITFADRWPSEGTQQ